MGLPFDICRCLGKGCNEKESCERYTDKAVGAFRVAYSDSLHDPRFDFCRSKIEIVLDKN